MFIGTQYYRPPFPDKKYWNDDLSLIRDTGLTAVQLWACWGWIEPKLGEFNFADYDDLWENYKPLPAMVGVLFEQDNYFLNWANAGTAGAVSSSILGYLSALEKLHIPYEVIESNHTDMVMKLKLLILPWAMIVNKKINKLLLNFVKRGGVLLTEGELDSFDSLGFYRYPGKRDFANLLEINDQGRRKLNENTVKLSYGKKVFKLKVSGWFNPLETKGASVLSENTQGDVIAISKNIGKGKVFVVGTFLGLIYNKEPYRDFEKFIYNVVKDADALPEIFLEKSQISFEMQYKIGVSGKDKFLFITNPGPAKEVNFKEGRRRISINVKADSWNVFLLKDNPKLLGGSDG